MHNVRRQLPDDANIIGRYNNIVDRHMFVIRLERIVVLNVI